jgi:membrane protein implicated in regulation of membrane protease activity
MDWSGDTTQWLLWLAAALAAGLIEIATVDFIFLMVAGGAVAATAAAAAGAPPALQVVIFAASSVGLLVVARPPLQRWARNTPSIAMNAAALVGQQARVLETVTDRAGTVKLDGEVWTARVLKDEPSLEVGSDVHVVRIDGATAIVAPRPASPDPNSLEGRPTQ